MRGQTYLWKRGGSYYFRIRVPNDLLSLYAPKHEIKMSLRTPDRREAAHLCRLKALELTAEFDRKRHQLKTARGQKPMRLIKRIDQAFIDQIKMRWKWEALANDEVQRREGLDAEEFAELRAQADETQRLLQNALATGDHAIIHPALNNQLYLLGIELDVSAEDYQRLAYAYLQAVTETTDLIRRRNAGEVIETRQVAQQEKAYPLSPSNVKRDGLMDLYDYWRAAVKRPTKTEAAYKATVTLFLDAVGDKPADELRKADFVAFKDALLARDLHFKTVGNKLVHLKSVLNHAVANDRLEANPAAQVKVAKPKVAPVSRLPFDPEDLQAIFASPLYVAGERPRGGAGEAAAWLPLLALYTGARENELGQLMVGDVLKDPVAGYYINVIDNEADEGGSEKSVKTVASRRKVPLHPALFKAGFIKYRDAMAKAGSERLFPDLVPDCHGHATGNWSKWFGRYLRTTMGITHPKKVFHSFRHNFKDACRNAGLGEDIHDALTGHTNGSVGRGYGQGHSLKVLAKAVARIRYPGVVLPGIPPPTPNRKRSASRM